jgi:hypothetical protein
MQQLIPHQVWFYTHIYIHIIYIYIYIHTHLQRSTVVDVCQHTHINICRRFHKHIRMQLLQHTVNIHAYAWTYTHTHMRTQKNHLQQAGGVALCQANGMTCLRTSQAGELIVCVCVYIYTYIYIFTRTHTQTQRERERRERERERERQTDKERGGWGGGEEWCAPAWELRASLPSGSPVSLGSVCAASFPVHMFTSSLWFNNHRGVCAVCNFGLSILCFWCIFVVHACPWAVMSGGTLISSTGYVCVSNKALC